jgi:ABC-type glycerol-3-phosphate transport system substrate-binding protein
VKNLKIVYVLLIAAVLLAAAPAASAAPAAAVTCEQTHNITAGDQLGLLADRFYGSVDAFWALMYGTNQKHAEDPTFARIDNADLIEVGWKLCVISKAEADAFLATFDPAKADSLAKLFPAGAKGQLIVASWWTNGGEFNGLNQMFEQYKQQNPDVEIINAAIAGGAGTQFKGQLLSQLLGGVAPDVFQLHAGLEAETYNPGVLIIPVDDVYTKNNLEAVFSTNPVDNAEIG